MASDPTTLRLRVAEARELNPLIRLFRLRADDGAALPGFEAGAHIRVRVDLGNGQSDWRHYSLIDFAAGGQPAPAEYLIAVRKEAAGRGGSRFMHERLREGDTIEAEPPKNDFPLHAGAGRAVLLAGGIGITPIWCMAQRLQKLGASWEMHYSCRERPEVAFIDELSKLPNVKLHIDAESNGKFLDIPGIVAAAPAGAHFYCCGPIPMLNAYEEATKSLPEGHMHIEYFTAKEAAALDGGYKVRLERSGQEFTVPPGKTLLHVLRDAGVDVSYSCEEGVCGSCETVVISGTPDHRDNILTEAERKASKTMMICCSGSKSDLLVLDL